MKCCICGKEMKGVGNNPYPLCYKGDYKSRCCNRCDLLVVEARMEIVAYGKSIEEVQKKFLGRVCERC